MGGQPRHRWGIAAWLMLGAAVLPGLQAVRAEDAPRSLGDLYRALKSQQQDMAARQAREKALHREAETLHKQVTHLRAQMIETAARLQAQEDKVSALETALAESVKRDAALKQNLDRNDRSVAQTLTALERIALRPPAAIIGRPVDDAVDTIRTAMLLGAVVPTIEADAAQLRTQIEDLRASRRRTEAKRTSLAGASQALEAERTKLAALVQAKQEQEVGKRAEAAEEAKRAKAISAKADDLKDLIASLEREAAKRRAAAKARAAEQAKARAQELARRKAEAEAQGRSADTVTMPPPKPAPAERQLPAASAFARLKGHIRMPAHGTVVTWYGQKDSYGMRARGITIATRGDATVIAPCAGKVVFAGTFRNYGQLLIISPAHGYHVLLAGLARIDATRGQFLLMGEPVGQMASASRSAAGGAAGIDAEPRLYVEFRRNGEPIDPAQWLASSEKRVTG